MKTENPFTALSHTDLANAIANRERSQDPAIDPATRRFFRETMRFWAKFYLRSRPQAQLQQAA